LSDLSHHSILVILNASLSLSDQAPENGARYHRFTRRLFIVVSEKMIRIVHLATSFDSCGILLVSKWCNKNLSWCWQTRATHLEVSHPIS